jgi:hypothetical protein
VGAQILKEEQNLELFSKKKNINQVLNKNGDFSFFTQQE